MDDSPVARSRAHRPRLLVICPRPPSPPIGGDRVRIYNLCRELAVRYDLTLLSLCAAVPPRSELDDALFQSCEYVVLPRWRSWWQALVALACGGSLQLAYFRSKQLQRRAAALLPGHDAVLCHLIRTASAAAEATDAGIPSVLEMTDSIALSFERLCHDRPARWDLRTAIYRVEARRLKAIEADCAARFDVVSLISSVDRDHLLQGNAHPPRRLLVVPNGVHAKDIPAWSDAQITELVFIGNLHTLQNRDAVWFFVQSIWPALRGRYPAATLRIIGPCRPAEQQRLAQVPGVSVLGCVADLSDALVGAAIGVCPVRFGAGMQNKVLDYMAHGLATVTTTVGHEGVEATPGVHLQVADTPDEWVATLSAWMANPQMARALGHAARQQVQARYRWDRCVAPLISEIDRVIERQANRDTVSATAASSAR